MKQYIKIAVIILIMSIAAVGCGVIEKDNTIGKVIDGKEVMAKVNDEYVLKSDFEDQVNQVVSALEANGQDFSTSEGKQALKEIQEKVLEAQITDLLILQQAKKTNINVEEAEVDEAIEQLEQYHGGADALDSYLKQLEIDRNKLKTILRDQLTMNELYMQLTNEIVVTDEEVKKYYDDNKEMFELPSPEIRASHILVKTEEEAKEIHKKLMDGADFAELAKAHGIDGTKDVGGDLGYFGKGKMVPEFEEAAFALKVGEISDIVKTEHGYHIIKMTGERTSLSFEDVKDFTKNNLENTKKEEEFQKHIAQWEQQSKIEKYL